jgi:hypothetical protein
LGYRFFFDQVRTKIDTDFPNLSGRSDEGSAKARIAAKGTIDGYGWLNSIYDTAKAGIFTMPTETPVNSVLETKLYEIITYLSWKAACGSYEERVNELNEKGLK